MVQNGSHVSWYFQTFDGNLVTFLPGAPSDLTTILILFFRDALSSYILFTNAIMLLSFLICTINVYKYIRVCTSNQRGGIEYGITILPIPPSFSGRLLKSNGGRSRREKSVRKSNEYPHFSKKIDSGLLYWDGVSRSYFEYSPRNEEEMERSRWRVRKGMNITLIGMNELKSIHSIFSLSSSHPFSFSAFLPF